MYKNIIVCVRFPFIHVSTFKKQCEKRKWQGLTNSLSIPRIPALEVGPGIGMFMVKLKQVKTKPRKDTYIKTGGGKPRLWIMEEQ